jgi:hypothetical protein
MSVETTCSLQATKDDLSACNLSQVPSDENTMTVQANMPTLLPGSEPAWPVTVVLKWLSQPIMYKRE